MRRASTVLLVAVAALALAGAGARAAMLSKSYVFKPDIDLQISENLEGGLRLDQVHFYLPSTAGAPGFRTGGVPRADVTVSNVGEASSMFGVAICLLDEEGRLLAAANGGPKLFPLRPGRQGVFRVVFDGVNGEAFRAQRFMIAVESKSR